ncbi:MAG: hypothetical protein Phog2KO_02040 [Phototrophicaceae bacterium]
MSSEKRILYIDDNRDHLMIVQAMLQREGYVCDTFHNAEEGMQAALTKPYHLILLDIQMPKISGIEILEKLKTRKEEVGFNIIAVTADSSVFSKKNPFMLGFDAHLSKPILPKNLSRMVEQQLNTMTD